MKHVLGKEFLREILRNKGRFLSIFFIVMLGAAFFSGIRSAGSDMKQTADRYYDDSNLMDIRVVSTLGLTEEDLEDMAALEDVELVQGGYTQDVLIPVGQNEVAVKMIARTDQINQLMLVEGRSPENSHECVLDARFMGNKGYSIGDSISIHSGTDTPIEDSVTETVFTVVGSGNLPYYMDLTRGVGSIGDGTLSGYLVVSPEVFDLDVYTEAYIRVAGAKGLNSYSDQYSELVATVVDKLENIADSCEQRRYDRIRQDAEEQIADGKEEIADAKQDLQDAKEELDDGEEKLKDGKKELQDAKKELDDGEKELQDAKKELDDGERELQDAKEELKSAEKQLSDSRQQLDSGKQQLEAAEAEVARGEAKAAQGRSELDGAAARLSAAKQQLDTAEAQLKASEAELEAGKQQLDSNRAELEAGMTELETQEGLLAQKEDELEAGWQEYEAGLQTLEQMKAVLPPDSPQIQQLEEALNASYQQLTAARELITEGKAQLAQQRAVLEAAKEQLEVAESQYQAGLDAYSKGLEEYKAGKTVYEESYAAWQAGEEEWAAGMAELETGRAQLEASRQTYLQGEQQWQEGSQSYESGKQKYQEGVSSWENGKKEYEDGLQTWKDGKKEYEDGLKEYNSNLKKWEDGKEEYQEAEEEALPKIADAEEEIADAEKKLKELEVPTWYVLDRDKISSCVSYGTDAERMDSLGNVFPVLFFLVAALVSLTAMTRMVEEQRLQIGTMKALGYKSGAIAGKYLGYAMLATVTGAVIGVVIGEKSLPWVIMSAYGMLYTGLPYQDTPLNLTQGSLAVILSVLCTGGATLAACGRKLSDSPAKLMRPEAPMSGSRILLERISFLWKRFSFTRKSTLRNLFRYKKRFIMTIIGIGGCMGLMLVGFGIRDSITVVAQNQYVDIFMQDATVTVDTDAEEEIKDQLLSTVNNYQGVSDSMEVSLNSVTLNANGKDRTAFLYVPDNTEQVKEYVRFRDRKSKEQYDYPIQGAALAEKTASMLDVKVGDTVRIQKGEGEPYVEVQVETIVENYVQHYIFISPDTYEQLFGEPADNNLVYVKYEDFTEKEEEDFGRLLLKNDACIGFSTTTALEKQILDMLKTLNNVIWVLIIAAALLAFVVLYNLNSINMTERKRELATLKVLGFYDPEVAMYVYRENILLTILGIAAGCFLGKVLHLFTILTVEVDLMMFGRVIGWKSYVVCGILTVAFSVLVNLIMYSHFKKIDMIESLKSVE